MGNYSQLKKAIAEVIKTNGVQAITGDVLQSVLLTAISTIGKYAQFGGVATPETNPQTPDQNVFYLATERGVYPNFNAIEIDLPAIVFYNGTRWEAFDIVARTQLAGILFRKSTEAEIADMIANKSYEPNVIYYTVEE